MEPFTASVTNSLAAVLTAERLAALLRAAVLLTAGIVLSRLAAVAMRRGLRSLSRQQQLIARRSVVYTLLTLFTVSALRELGFRFEVLLGAAGIITVAVGFASQTSASNLISGLFLILERAVEIGDIVKVGDVMGEVLTVDLLSTRLRTFDNLTVRIPNETMVKSQITNYNRLPIRRFDLQVGVAYRSDLAQVQRVLLEVAARNPLCLEEPAPMLMAKGFGDNAVNYQLSVWAIRERWLEVRNAITREVKEAFDVHAIEIPYPHVSVYGGVEMEPIPLRWVRDAPPPDPGAPAVGQDGDAADAPREDAERHGSAA